VHANPYVIVTTAHRGTQRELRTSSNTEVVESAVAHAARERREEERKDHKIDRRITAVRSWDRISTRRGWLEWKKVRLPARGRMNDKLSR
jgi:hypothetical protein